jgi:hypothetical protein
VIEHLTLVIAGIGLVAYAEWVKPQPGPWRERLVDALWYGGAFVFLVATLSALMGALGIGG